MKKLKVLLAIIFSVYFSPLFAHGIIFSGETDGQFDLYKTDTDFSHIKRLTHAKSNETMPAISPDGKMLAFISDRDGANSIYLNYNGKIKNISAGVGVYANPAFSPSCKQIAVRYSPDPQAPLLNTKIVLLDIASRTQKIILDSDKVPDEKDSGVTIVVDRPAWISPNLLAYTMIEYADVDAGRISKSTIYMLNISNGESARIAGGESYFDANGKSLGFRATMPSYIVAPQGRMITFVASRGSFDRFAMKYLLNGKGKSKMNLKDEDFFGPLLYDGKDWIYGYMNDDAVPGIAIRKGSLTSKRHVLVFKGQALSPVLIP